MVAHVSPKQAWAALQADGRAQLIDVRTPAEWQHVGVPDLDAAGKQPVLVSWQTLPGGPVNPAFMDEVRNAGLEPDQKLYFLCRSGVRSLSAAEAAQAAGFLAVFNVAEGFEGQPDGQGQRGTVSGWKADGLAWRR